MILFRKARRRHPGIYWYRTRKHRRPGTEWGYVGKSNHLARRADCHEGRCARHPGCAGGKPWADLIVRRGCLELPWWLGWQPVTLAVETIVILVLRPRYNWQKNPRRSKVPPSVQKRQREHRDALALHSPRIHPARQLDLGVLVPVLGVVLILAGATGWLFTR